MWHLITVLTNQRATRQGGTRRQTQLWPRLGVKNGILRPCLIKVCVKNAVKHGTNKQPGETCCFEGLRLIFTDRFYRIWSILNTSGGSQYWQLNSDKLIRWSTPFWEAFSDKKFHQVVFKGWSMDDMDTVVILSGTYLLIFSWGLTSVGKKMAWLVVDLGKPLKMTLILTIFIKSEWSA